MSLPKAEAALIARLASLSPDGVARQRRVLVAELQAYGWTYRQIADALGVTKAAVGNWMAR